MGCGPSFPDDSINRGVEAEIQQDDRANSHVPKLLLLGVGGSGKSTFFKQLLRIHGGGIGDLERRTYQGQIYEQMISQMKVLVEKMSDLCRPGSLDNENGEYDKLRMDEEGEQLVSSLMRIPDDSDVSEQVGWVLKALWANRAILAGFDLRAKLCVFDSCDYFWNDIDRITSPQWVPTDQDCIMCRNATTGMTDREFVLQGERVRIVDVGGQRSERRKWMHFFDNVTAVLYVASLSAYNEVLYEDETANVMHESLKVFKDTINSTWFGETPVLLFLNKADLFREKLKKDPITVCWTDYTGGIDHDESLKFVQGQFRSRNHNRERQLFLHVTTATDSKNVQRVFDDVRHTVIAAALDKVLL